MLYFISGIYSQSKEVCLEFILGIGVLLLSTPNTVFKTHPTIWCENTPMVCQTFIRQIWWVMVCSDLAHQIWCSKHTFSGRCEITPMVCCSFGGHSTPQFLQCTVCQGCYIPVGFPCGSNSFAATFCHQYFTVS